MSRSQVPGTRVVLGISLAALAAAAFGGVSIGALAPDLEHAFGLSRAEVGIVSALVSLGASIGSRPFGRLTDRLGPYRVIMGSLLGIAAGAAVQASAQDEWMLMAGTLMLGLAYGAVGPPTNVAIAGRSMAGGIGFFMSVKQAGMPAGSFLAGIVLPSVAVGLSWRWAFALTGIVAVAVASFAGPLRRSGSIDRAGRGGAGIGRDVAPPRHTWWVLGAFGFLMAGGQWAFLAYLVLYLTDSRGFGHAEAGAVLAAATAASVGGRMLWGWVSDRPGWRSRSLVGAATIASIGCALLAAGLPGAAVWPAAMLTGAALIGWNGAFLGLVADRAKRGTVGHASGIVMTIVFAGAVGSPPLFGYISQATDTWWVLWALAGGGAALAGLVLVLFLPPDPGPQAATDGTGGAEAPGEPEPALQVAPGPAA